MLTNFVIVIILSSYGAAHTHSVDVLLVDRAACDARATEIAKEIRSKTSANAVVFCEATR